MTEVRMSASSDLHQRARASLTWAPQTGLEEPAGHPDGRPPTRWATDARTAPPWPVVHPELGDGDARASMPSEVLLLSLEMFAHDVRSALAASRMSIAAVAASQQGESGRMLDAVAGDLQGVYRLLEEVLDLERLGFGQSEVISVDELVRDIVARCSAPRSVQQLTVPVAVAVDPNLLSRAVHNLVENALRHADELVIVQVGPTADGASIVVDDDGPGIPAELREVVFEPLARLDPYAEGGAGLGLTLARRAVELARGRLWAEASPCGGARFCVELHAGQCP